MTYAIYDIRDPASKLYQGGYLTEEEAYEAYQKLAQSIRKRYPDALVHLMYGVGEEEKE